MLLRRQLLIAVLMLVGWVGSALAFETGQSGMLTVTGELIDFGRSGFVGGSSHDTGKFADPVRVADVGKDVQFAHQIMSDSSGESAIRQVVASEPMASSMYVLGFSLIGFALVARRRSSPLPSCE